MVTVLVGSQVSGQILELAADFNSEVQAGQIIARIDPETFTARRQQAEAELGVARANVAIQAAGADRSLRELENARAALAAAQAQIDKAAAAHALSRRNHDRRKALFQTGAVSESQVEDTKAVHDQSGAALQSAQAEEKAAAALLASREAGLRAARAQVDYAREQVRQREAALNQAQVDLGHTFIRSPVDGVVIERAVDVGQTVAASLQAPKLFTIARDLREMQVEADVDEADIGRVEVGQPVGFTVDAYPGREFHGRVLQVRKAPRVVQNVVTYTVLASAANDDKRLLPGMTANVQIVVAERTNVLKIPNAALRFRPEDAEARPPASPLDRPSEAPAAGEAQPPEERLRQLAALLSLSESQQNQVRAIFAENRERLAALRLKGALPDEVRREATALREKGRSAIAALLTPPQREKFAAAGKSAEGVSGSRGRVYVIDESRAGQPAAVDLVIGITDGTFTEVLRGGLDSGRQVVVGVQSPQAKSSARSGARLGF